mgnify:FL=1
MAKYEIPDYAFDEVRDYLDSLCEELEESEHGSVKAVSTMAEQIGAMRALRKLGFYVTFKHTSYVDGVTFYPRLAEEVE